MKRRRQETVTQWINRHSEALWEASRAVKRVQREHQPSTRGDGTPRQDHGGPQGTSRSVMLRQAAVSGRRETTQRTIATTSSTTMASMATVPKQLEAATSDRGWQDRDWSHWDWWSRGQWREEDWRRKEYEPPSTWHLEEDDFLPDFLVGFLLLHRSGLDANERANILAAIKGEFSVMAVSKALREQWSDEDLFRRDRRKEQAMFMETEDYDFDEDAAVADYHDAPDPTNEPEAYAAFQEEQVAIDEALEAIQQYRRTLKDARWRQHQVKMNRKFYPMKGKGAGDHGKGRQGSFGSTGKGRDNRNLKCLRCGGAHNTAACPQKSGSAQHAEEEAEIAFFSVDVPKDGYLKEMIHEVLLGDLENFVPDPDGDETKDDETGHGDKANYMCIGVQEDNLSAEAAMTCHREIIAAGMGIVDCGATASLASVDALEAIMAANRRDGGDDRVTVLPDLRPTFRFGNGERKECISSVHLQVSLADRTGKMQLHVHDTPQQPVLISVKALKQLGAVIDFSSNECVFAKVDPSAVVRLDTADNGHLLMPLSSNLLEKARPRKTPFLGLAAE